MDGGNTTVKAATLLVVTPKMFVTNKL